ncbi:hypothetical protein TrVE_jg9227 [Triparma verrucosa]|uniref:Uncharacterized protein n=1 Tax=Triparma verrucosa TaxID=1606542 RepID=A0A9W7BF46_9STRA|nr:hypothetical protein TrVE_jg9227 [Triparma verrucosa]
MGGWFSSSCKYNSGFNKNNACPPGFLTEESCSWFSTKIECKLTKEPSADAVPVSARYNLVGDCDGDVGGSTAPSSAGQCQGGDRELGTRTSPCCSNVFGGCTSSNAYAMKEIKTCADGNGDLVFDVWGPQGCKDKASGLSNNFAAQQWCKDGNTRSGNCWIPYSLQLNDDDSTSCFPLDKDRSGQWTDVSIDGWTATSKFGGSLETLEGSSAPISDFKNAWEEPVTAQVKVGPIGAAGGAAVGAAAVICLFTRRKLRTKKDAKGDTGVSDDGTQMV